MTDSCGTVHCFCYLIKAVNRVSDKPRKPVSDFKQSKRNFLKYLYYVFYYFSKFDQCWLKMLSLDIAFLKLDCPRVESGLDITK